MAISASCNWEVRISAMSSNIGGGLFNPGASGSDFSLQDSPQYTLLNQAIPGAQAVIPYATAAADMVGNGAHLINGTSCTVGWYEIISAVVNSSITVDRNICGGAATIGTLYIGGAISLCSAVTNQNDDDFFEAVVPGNTVHIQKGTYNLGAAISTATTPNSFLPVTWEGYNSARFDDPQGSDRPLLNAGANSLTPADYTHIHNMIIHTGGATGALCSVNGAYVNVKVVNKSATANRAGITLNQYSQLIGCDAVSLRGRAVNAGVIEAPSVKSSYLHDSDIGFLISTTGLSFNFDGNVVASNVTRGVQLTGASGDAPGYFINNTFYGAEAKRGDGVVTTSIKRSLKFFNNIVYGFNTGVNSGSSHLGAENSYNNYYNNTTDRTNFPAGSKNLAVDPQFTNVSQVIATGCTTSGSTLTKAGATFITSGVVAGRDYAYITNSSTGMHYITSVDSETQLTLEPTPPTDAGGISVQITVGHDFTIGNSLLKAVAAPVFIGESVNQLNIGAVQNSTASSSGSGTTSTRKPKWRL